MEDIEQKDRGIKGESRGKKTNRSEREKVREIRKDENYKRSGEKKKGIK